MKDGSRSRPTRASKRSAKTRGDTPNADIRHVAAEAGVSTATVSRVTSGRGPVSEATRLQVLAAIEKLHYLPSESARSLRSARTMMMGVVVPDLANPVFIPFLRGVQHVAQSHGYAVLVVDAQRSVEVERRALDRLVAQRVDALVLAGSARDPARIEELRQSGMAIADADAGEDSSTSLVPELERPGTLAMCDALAQLGHRRVGYVTQERASGEAGSRRWNVIQQRCQQLHVRTERITLPRVQTPDNVSRLFSNAIERPEAVTALVCSNHGLAPTVLRGLSAAQIQLPGDCSFVTYGDSEWAAAYRPAIGVVTYGPLRCRGAHDNADRQRARRRPGVLRRHSRCSPTIAVSATPERWTCTNRLTELSLNLLRRVPRGSRSSPSGTGNSTSNLYKD